MSIRQPIETVDLLLNDLIDPGSPASGVKMEHSLLRELVDRIEAVPAEEIPAAHYSKFKRGCATLKAAMGPGIQTEVAQAVLAVRQIVNDILDAPPSPQQSRFHYIADAEFRRILERDVDEAESSLRHDNWKACIVLCGSILEAALYEYLLRDPTWTMDPSRSNVPSISGSATKKDIRRTDLANQWTLDDLIKFAVTNGVVKGYTTQHIRDAVQQPRNLIHPRKEIRSGVTVDRGRAGVSIETLKALLDEIGQLPGMPPP